MCALLLVTVLLLEVIHKLVIFGMAFYLSAVTISPYICQIIQVLLSLLQIKLVFALCFSVVVYILLLWVSLESMYSRPAAVSIFHRFAYLSVLSSRCSSSGIDTRSSSSCTDSFLSGLLHAPGLHEPRTDTTGHCSLIHHCCLSTNLYL